MKWQPIETAPKDGTLVLLHVDFSGRQHRLHDAVDWAVTTGQNCCDNTGEDVWEVVGWDWSFDAFETEFIEPGSAVTHWMPLPPPPKRAPPRSGFGI